MPGREPWTYGNWSSDVTARAKSTTNRGRTEAAGVMPGACQVRQVLQKPQSGRVLQVGVRLRAKRCSRQGSRGPLAVLTGGAGHISRTKAVTCDCCIDGATGGGPRQIVTSARSAGFPEGTDAAVRADGFGRSCPLWLCLGSGRYGCTCVRYRYELGRCYRWNLAALVHREVHIERRLSRRVLAKVHGFLIHRRR